MSLASASDAGSNCRGHESRALGKIAEAAKFALLMADVLEREELTEPCTDGDPLRRAVRSRITLCRNWLRSRENMVFVATASGLFNEAHHIARKFASIDHSVCGRARGTG